MTEFIEEGMLKANTGGKLDLLCQTAKLWMQGVLAGNWECYSSEHMNNKETRVIADRQKFNGLDRDQTRCNISLNQNNPEQGLKSLQVYECQGKKAAEEVGSWGLRKYPSS